MLNDAPTGLRAEDIDAPIALAETRPWLSWLPPATLRDPQGAEIAITVAGRTTTHRVAAACGATWPADPLPSRSSASWRVRVQDASGAWSAWSSAATLRTGLLQERDWSAPWIAAPGFPSPVLRCAFTLADPCAMWLHVAALGWIEARINGVRVPLPLLAPRWRDPRHGLDVLTAAVGDLLRLGANVLTLIPAQGYAGRFGAGPLRWRVQLEDDDGRVIPLPAAAWQARPGARLRDDPYHGEHIDARLLPDGWDQPGHDDGGWIAVHGGVIAQGAVAPAGRLTPARGRGSVVSERRVLVSVPVGADIWRVDAGANGSGWLHLAGSARAGTRLRIHHAELQHADGALDTATNRAAAARDEYVTAGGDFAWAPSATCHGFRYAEITSDPPLAAPPTITLCRVHEDAPAHATFTCDDARLNQLFAASVATFRACLHGVLVDCPQRDERQGWLGDAHAVLPSVLRTVDCAPLVRAWLDDCDGVQDADGVRWSAIAPPDPDHLLRARRSCPLPELDRLRARVADDSVYTAALTLLPWQLFHATGDAAVCAARFDYILAHLRTWTAHRDWPLPDSSRHGDHAEMRMLFRETPTPKPLVAGLILHREFRTAAQMAEVLERSADAVWCRTRAAELAAALRSTYAGTDHGFASMSGAALALSEGLAADPTRTFTALVADLERHGGHATCGIIAMGDLLDVLCRHGRSDLAVGAVLATGDPGFLHMLRDGLGTLCENSTGLWSFHSRCHPALGVIAGWMLRHLAGLDDVAPGGAELELRPACVPAVGAVQAQLSTPRGTVRAELTPTPTGWHYTVALPPGCRARFHSAGWTPMAGDATSAGLPPGGAGTWTRSG